MCRPAVTVLPRGQFHEDFSVERNLEAMLNAAGFLCAYIFPTVSMAIMLHTALKNNFYLLCMTDT